MATQTTETTETIVEVTENTNSKEVKFKDDLVKVANHIENKLVADSATGTLTLPAGWAFDAAIAPAGVTEESYAAHRHYQDLLNNGVTLAASRRSVPMFKENKQLESVTLKAPIWKNDAYEGTFNRRGTSRNPGTGEVSSFSGAIGVGRINVVSTRTKAEMQGIKQNLRNLAEAAGLDD